MRGGYVGLMNCVFAAQKAVRFILFTSYFTFLHDFLHSVWLRWPWYTARRSSWDTLMISISPSMAHCPAYPLSHLDYQIHSRSPIAFLIIIHEGASLILLESPYRCPNPPTLLLQYPAPNIPTTSLTSHRRGLLAMEWKRRSTRIFTCTSLSSSIPFPHPPSVGLV